MRMVKGPLKSCLPSRLARTSSNALRADTARGVKMHAHTYSKIPVSHRRSSIADSCYPKILLTDRCSLDRSPLTMLCRPCVVDQTLSNKNQFLRVYQSWCQRRMFLCPRRLLRSGSQHNSRCSCKQILPPHVFQAWVPDSEASHSWSSTLSLARGLLV